MSDPIRNSPSRISSDSSVPVEAHSLPTTPSAGSHSSSVESPYGDGGAKMLKTAGVIADQVSLPPSPKSREEITLKGRNFTVLGEGAAKLVLQGTDPSDVNKVFLIAKNQGKVSEIQTEVSTVQSIKQAIDFNVIVDDVKARYEKNPGAYQESKEALNKSLNALSTDYTIDKLQALCRSDKLTAQKEMMERTGCNTLEAKELLAVLGHPAYVSEGKEQCDIDALKANALQRQSNLAVDLEVVPEDVLGTYAVVSTKAMGDLEGLMKSNELSFADRASICDQVKEAVKQMHAAGFVHGDLKPDNFLVYKDADGKCIVKLSDFGKTRPISPGEELSRFGNPRFVGPENKTSKPGEVYAVGLIGLRVMEEPFLEGTESLAEPFRQVASPLRAKEGRRGIEKFLLNSSASAQVETKSALGKIVRMVNIVRSTSDSKQVQKEVFSYIQELTGHLVGRLESAPSQQEREGIQSCIDQLSFLHDALNSNPRERPALL
jgi:serine/threonine protein kinase